jgi:DNA-binding response OmpR family regulator
LTVRLPDSRKAGNVATVAPSTPLLLVVDDDVDIVQTLGLCLRAEGYRVALARNGREALEKITDERPAAVLLDLMMPVMDGWQFVAELRARGLGPPLLVLSADNAVERHAGNLEASGHLAKPFDLDELLSKVRQLVGPAA